MAKQDPTLLSSSKQVPRTMEQALALGYTIGGGSWTEEAVGRKTIVRKGTADLIGNGWEHDELEPGSFDLESQGVPYWFPREAVHNRRRENESRERLSPENRLAWFDKALAYYAQTEWPPAGSVKLRQRAVALSLLQMLYVVELEYGRIPTPQEM